MEGFDPFAVKAPAAPVAGAFDAKETKRTLVDFNPFEGQGAVPVMHAVADPNNPYTQLPHYAPMMQCRACSARTEALQVVPGKGPLDARMLVIGQNPGEDEDRAGEPFIGQSGEEFNSWLPVLGLDRDKMLVTNVVKCHTLKNRVPRAKEIRTCADLWLSAELQSLPDVQVLITLGKPAVLAVLQKSAPPMVPVMIHHYRVRVLGRELRVFPLPHPAFFLRARHLAPMFRETLLPQLKLTLLQETPEAYAWTKR